jgi:MoxR-like ATPase
MSDIQQLERLATSYTAIRKEVGKVIIGQDHIVEELLITLFAGGHCLLVGVPGLAKTLLIRTVAQVLELSFNRVQFTPDLMPSDITGTEIIEDDITTGRKQFRFVHGPIFANIVLADEINRTPPKTQAALLEAMQEHSVTAAGKTYRLPEPFFVLATQNPIEQEGTYPLPEAQLDRFMFNVRLDYPSYEDEIKIVLATTVQHMPTLQRIIDARDIIHFQELVRRIPVPENVAEYAVKLVHATRPGNTLAPASVRDLIRYGAGPRASQYLVLGAKTRAALQGRTHPTTDDIRAVAVATLRHRIVTTYNAEAENITGEEIVRRLIESLR